MPRPLSEQSVAVAGDSSGIGRATVLLLSIRRVLQPRTVTTLLGRAPRPGDVVRVVPAPVRGSAT